MVLWRVREVRDAFRMAREHVGFVAQMKKLLSMTMCHPFTVLIDDMPHILKQDMKILAKTDWTRSMMQILLWRFCVGIVPYFIVKVDKTAHAVPHIPSHMDGDIDVVKDEGGRKQFQWRWTNWNSSKKRAPPEIHWLYTGDEPDVDGTIVSPAMAALEDWRLLCVAREDAEYASYHASHPHSVYEDKPPVSGRDENKYEDVRFDLYGDDAINRLIASEDRQHEHEIQYARRDDVLNNLAAGGFMSEAQMKMMGVGGQLPVLQSDDSGRDFNRRRFIHNSVILPKDRHFAGQFKHEAILNIAELDQALTIKAGELIGIPTEMTQSTSKQHLANKGGIQMAATETLKATIQWMNDALTIIYTQIYGETILNGWDKFYSDGTYNLYPPRHFRSTDGALRHELHVASKVSITVELQCDPVLEIATIYELHEKGFIDKDTAAELLTSKTGLSKGTLRALANPDRFCIPPQDAAKLKLEEKKLQSDQQKYDLEREKIKSSEKMTTLQLKNK